MTRSAVEHPRDLLDAAARDVAERNRLWARRTSELVVVEACRREVQAARARLVDETTDVERLEHLSPARIWATLRNDRAERLDTERAEQQAAEYAVGVAEERLGAAERRLVALDRALTALGDVDTRHRQVLAAAETWVHQHGGAAASQLDAIAREAATVAAHQRETNEAYNAAQAAAAHLEVAADRLRGMRDFYQPFSFNQLTLPGGFDAYDSLTTLMRNADLSLRWLSAELADLGWPGLASLGDVEVGDLTATLAFWTNDIFTDVAMANRFDYAGQRVMSVRHTVWQVQTALYAAGTDLAARAVSLAQRREDLLRTS